jgi:hypothetical protein
MVKSYATAYFKGCHVPFREGDISFKSCLDPDKVTPMLLEVTGSSVLPDGVPVVLGVCLNPDAELRRDGRRLGREPVCPYPTSLFRIVHMDGRVEG